MISYASRQEAESLLEWASDQNPGQWADHSKVTARAAYTIAEACSMDKDMAYSLGLLHDIGRYEGVRKLHHTISGYQLMEEKNFLKNGHICLTHSFPYKHIKAYSGKFDCTLDEIDFIEKFIENCVYDDYDRLIQLCDALCLPQGVCLIEVRLMDVARRYGFNDYTLVKWESLFEIKAYFDKLCGQNIYDLFYDEIRNISFN